MTIKQRDLRLLAFNEAYLQFLLGIFIFHLKHSGS